MFLPTDPKANLSLVLLLLFDTEYIMRKLKIDLPWTTDCCRGLRLFRGRVTSEHVCRVAKLSPDSFLYKGIPPNFRYCVRHESAS